MTRIRVRIERNRLPEIARILPEAADALINRKHGPRMQQIAASRSRVDTGAMRDGWQWNATGQGTGELVNEVPHTVFNEYGTRHLSPAPMARPAAEQVFPDIVDDFERIAEFLR